MMGGLNGISSALEKLLEPVTHILLLENPLALNKGTKDLSFLIGRRNMIEQNFLDTYKMLSDRLLVEVRKGNYSTLNEIIGAILGIQKILLNHREMKEREIVKEDQSKESPLYIVGLVEKRLPEHIMGVIKEKLKEYPNGVYILTISKPWSINGTEVQIHVDKTNGDNVFSLREKMGGVPIEEGTYIINKISNDLEVYQIVLGDIFWGNAIGWKRMNGIPLPYFHVDPNGIVKLEKIPKTYAAKILPKEEFLKEIRKVTQQ